MSLDLTLQALAQFSRELEAFDATLASSYRELQTRHDAINALWRDESRLTYDRSMAEIDSRLRRYLGGESARYEEFIRQKCRQLEGFLNGS